MMGIAEREQWEREMRGLFVLLGGLAAVLFSLCLWAALFWAAGTLTF